MCPCGTTSGLVQKRHHLIEIQLARIRDEHAISCWGYTMSPLITSLNLIEFRFMSKYIKIKCL
jgi:hypothetical protein